MWGLGPLGAAAQMRTEPHREFRASEPRCGLSRIEHSPLAGECVAVFIVVVVVTSRSDAAESKGHQGYQRLRRRHLSLVRCRRRCRPPWGVVAVSPRYQESRDQRATTGRRASFRYRPDRPPTPHSPYHLSPARAAWPLRACPGPSGHFTRGPPGERVAFSPAGLRSAANTPGGGIRFRVNFGDGLGAISPLTLPP